MAELRFVSHSGSLKYIMLGRENESTLQETEKDVSLFGSFLRTKNEDTQIEDIPALELNQYISPFIASLNYHSINLAVTCDDELRFLCSDFITQ